MANEKLTIKQEKYVQGLFAGLSQREAYKQAGYNIKNYTDESIDVEACKLANNTKVVQRLEGLKDELKERNMVTADKVISEFAHIAFDDISNYLDYRTEKTVVGYDESGSPITEYRTIVDLKDSKTIDTRNISEVSTGPNGTFKFKQYCKDNALLQLAKIMGLMTEKVDLKSSNLNLNTEVSGETDADRIKSLVKLMSPEQKKEYFGE